MECAIQAVIEEPQAAAADFVRLHDARRRHLGVPPQLQLRTFSSRGLKALTRAFAPIRGLWENIHVLVESYYLAADRPALVSLQTTLRSVAEALGAVVIYTYRVCRATSSALSKYAIATLSLDTLPTLGTKAMVFKYGYFAHGMDVKVGTKNNGVLIADALDQGSINLSFERVAYRGLLQLTRLYDRPSDEAVCSRAVGFDNNHGDDNRFITCVAVDPMPCFGSTIMVCYSTGEVEIWRETVSMTDLRDALCEAVAQCKLQSYPFYCAFSPAGELAVVLTVDNMYLMEWNGSSLSGVKLVAGSTADLWSTTRSRVLAAEWLNIHEILSLSDKGELWLSRRSEMGYWQRTTQYILRESMTKDVGLTSWISRMQYDTRGLLFVKMFGSHQLLQLKWDKSAMPDVSILEFPPRDTLGKPRAVQDNRDASTVMVADFALEQHSSLIAIVLSDRSMVYIYSYPNIRFMHAIGPPKAQLRVGGVKFVTAGAATPEAYLAIKWVEVSIEIFQQQDDFDIDHKLLHSKTEQSARVTVVYAVTTGSIQVKDWKGKTLADILARDESEVTVHSSQNKLGPFRRYGANMLEPLPRLSVFRPTFPDKLPGGTKNTVMFEDAFSHRKLAFGKQLVNGDSHTFPLDGGASLVSRRANELLRGDVDAETPVYTMEEFSRRKRGTL
ncbi:branched-chain alpha-keto acid dehydrogenase subunit E2, putative [Babesia ovis]|uniref:Branched-chain alpha-keto acid dehydrogenase subunit E2, putative n=1 Tax=Babesia ovis TaxID=5869 RepID=A0A9W5TEP1_BABOV|nr:branched-chain alpha-keto acid dehydrogenase subunit E2, putative [Babesia ovis]